MLTSHRIDGSRTGRQLALVTGEDVTVTSAAGVQPRPVPGEPLAGTLPDGRTIMIPWAGDPAVYLRVQRKVEEARSAAEAEGFRRLDARMVTAMRPVWPADDVAQRVWFVRGRADPAPSRAWVFRSPVPGVDACELAAAVRFETRRRGRGVTLRAVATELFGEGAATIRSLLHHEETVACHGAEHTLAWSGGPLLHALDHDWDTGEDVLDALAGAIGGCRHALRAWSTGTATSNELQAALVLAQRATTAADMARAPRAAPGRRH